MSQSTSSAEPDLATNGPILLGVVVLTLTLAFFPNIVGITTEWLGNGPYSHGFLALAIVAWILWKEQHQLVPNRPNAFWLLFVLGGGLGWWIADVVNVQFLQNIALIGILYSAVLFMFGWNAFYRLKIPLFSLLLILPVWNFLQIPLQEISSDVTFVVLKLFDIPIFREGFRFSVPGGQFIVEEACSGLGFFLTSILLAVLFCYYNNVKGIRQLYFFVFAIVLSLVANWIRIIIIMVVGNYTQMDHFIVEDHLTFGWIVFSLTLIPFFVVGHYLAERNSDQNDRHDPVRQTENSQAVRPVQMVALIVAMTLFPAISFVEAALYDSTDDENQVLAVLNAHLTPSKPQKVDWQPVFSGATEIAINAYSDQQDSELMGMVVRYNRQQQGKELIYVNNSLFDKARWVENNRYQVGTESEIGAQVLSLKDQRGDVRTIAYWYLIGGRQTTSPVIAKALELRGAILGDRSAYLIAMSVDSNSYGRRDAETSLIDTVSRLQHELATTTGELTLPQ